MNRILLILLLIGLLPFISCYSNVASRPLDELSQDFGSSEQYLVKEGDTLMVQVWGEPKLSGEVLVREDGRFTLPLIGDVVATGRSLEQISWAVSEQLEDYLSNASVSVSVLHSAPTVYYLSGTFIRPGEYRSDGRITLLQAISTGGGFAPFANQREIILIRKAIDGEHRYTLDYNRVLDGREPNPAIRNGDVIAVR
jgi:polysaccharide biosynthesis/export protein